MAAGAVSSLISFSLCTVFAEPGPRPPGGSSGRRRERMHPQSTDGLSAQVALLQSPILSAAHRAYHFPRPVTKQTHRKWLKKNNSKGLTASLIAGDDVRSPFTADHAPKGLLTSSPTAKSPGLGNARACRNPPATVHSPGEGAGSSASPMTTKARAAAG